MSQRKRQAKARMRRRGRRGPSYNRSVEPYAAVAREAPASRGLAIFTGSYMPAKFRNRMTYSEAWNVTTAGGIQAYQYKMNSIYDPYNGAGGNGVYGIDEMSAIYDRYKVVRATITVTGAAQAVESTNIWLCANGSSTAMTKAKAEAAPGVVYGLLGQYWPQTFTLTSTPGRWLQGPNDRDLTAATNADPSVMAYFHILIQNFSASALNIMLRVQIVYDVEWSGLKTVDNADG